MSNEEKKIPYELQSYISRRQRLVGDSNQADHRPTYQGELDGVRDTAVEQYDRGLNWIATLTPEEKGRARRYLDWRQKNTSVRDDFRYISPADLTLYRREGVGWLLVPFYLTYIDAANELMKVLLTPEEIKKLADKSNEVQQI